LAHKEDAHCQTRPIADKAFLIVLARVETLTKFGVCSKMQRVHLIRVMTDKGEHQIWLAATGRNEAVDRVLDAVPEDGAPAWYSANYAPTKLGVKSDAGRGSAA
jgi:hypothetical protein